jgi:hypothetical protein
MTSLNANESLIDFQYTSSRKFEMGLGRLIPTFCKSIIMTSSFMICGKLRCAKIMFSLFFIMLRTQDVFAKKDF